MTPDRFAALADAYGSEIDRWPEAEQEPARMHLLGNPDAWQWLQRQASLDAALGAWQTPRPRAGLAAAVAQNALDRHAIWRRVRLWLSGAGAAAALASGLVAGMDLAAVSMPPPRTEVDGLYGLQVLGMPLDPAPAPNDTGTL